MPSYKLMYFHSKGRAEISRYMFALAGVQYEDCRVNKEAWPALKPREYHQPSTLKGRAEISRYMFALAGVQYEDCRVNKEAWPALKPQTPCGTLPVLSVDGIQYSQSVPIAIYLAAEFGYYGKSPLENLAILEVVGIAVDLREATRKAELETDIDKKAEIMKNLKEEILPNVLKVLEKILTNASSEYFSGDKLTLADVTVMDALDTCSPVKENPELLDAFPKVKANFGTVRNNPKIKAYVEKDQ